MQPAGGRHAAPYHDSGAFMLGSRSHCSGVFHGNVVPSSRWVSGAEQPGSKPPQSNASHTGHARHAAPRLQSRMP